MDENYKTLLHIKENQLIKAFERNNMSCMIVKDEEVHTSFKKYFDRSKESCCWWECDTYSIGCDRFD